MASRRLRTTDESAQIVLFPGPVGDAEKSSDRESGNDAPKSPGNAGRDAVKSTAQPTTVVICGSFRKDTEGLTKVFQHFKDLNCRLLSPQNVDIQREVEGFVYMKGEEALTPETLERRHLDAIERADFVWLHAPDGYVGLSGSLEVGYANAVGTPVFSSIALQDPVLRNLVRVVDDPQKLVPRNESQPPIDVPKPSLRRFQDYYRRVAVQRGYEKESAQNCLLLMMEEIGELARGLRHEQKLIRHHGAITETPPELADVFIYLVHMANILDVDLGNVVRTKEQHNWDRFVQSRRKSG